MCVCNCMWNMTMSVCMGVGVGAGMVVCVCVGVYVCVCVCTVRALVCMNIYDYRFIFSILKIFECFVFFIKGTKLLRAWN